MDGELQMGDGLDFYLYQPVYFGWQGDIRKSSSSEGIIIGYSKIEGGDHFAIETPCYNGAVMVCIRARGDIEAKEV